MKTFRLLLATAGLAAVLSIPATAVEVDPGYVDVGQLLPSANGKFVEVNLSPAMLKFAAKIAAREEPEAAAMIGNLKRVRINVVGLDDTNRKATVEQIAGIRRKLESQGWEQLVSVREPNDSNNVDVHVRQRGETIEGLVVTVIGDNGEAVVVNIVGTIDADQIAQLADSFDIQPLKHVHIKGRKAAKAMDES